MTVGVGGPYLINMSLSWANSQCFLFSTSTKPHLVCRPSTRLPPTEVSWSLPITANGMNAYAVTTENNHGANKTLQQKPPYTRLGRLYSNDTTSLTRPHHSHTILLYTTHTHTHTHIHTLRQLSKMLVLYFIYNRTPFYFVGKASNVSCVCVCVCRPFNYPAAHVNLVVGV